MATVVASGSINIEVNNAEFGIESVPVPGMKIDDEVLLTSHITKGGAGPHGKGPLFCPFVHEKKANGFEVMVYDIQANKFSVKVPIDWAVIRSR